MSNSKFTKYVLLNVFLKLFYIWINNFHITLILLWILFKIGGKVEDEQEDNPENEDDDSTHSSKGGDNDGKSLENNNSNSDSSSSEYFI